MCTHTSSLQWHRSDYRAYFLWPVVALLTAAVGELFVGFSDRLAAWPFAISLLLIGMSHGAVDLVLTGRLTGATSAAETFARFCPYLGIMVGSLAALIAWPMATLAVFVCLSAIHFGFADSADLEDRGHVDQRSDVVRVVRGLSRGFWIVGLPLMVWPKTSLSFAQEIERFVGHSATSVDPRLLSAAAVVLVGSAVLANICLWGQQLLSGQRSVVATDFLETVTLGISLSVLSPLFGLGLYFLIWHSWRHLRRVSAFLYGETMLNGARLLQLHRASLPLLIPSLLCIAVLVVWRFETVTVSSFSVAAVATFTVVTLPHHFLVERLFDESRFGEPRTADSATAASPSGGLQSTGAQNIGAPSTGTQSTGSQSVESFTHQPLVVPNQQLARRNSAALQSNRE